MDHESPIVSQVTRDILEKQVAALLQAKDGICQAGADDSCGVHAMRVAARRIRTALKLFEGALPAALTEHLRGQLRWIARVLGAVRDLDQQLLQTRDLASELLSVEEGAIDPIVVILKTQRDEARSRLSRALVSPRYRRLEKQLRELLQAWPKPRSRRGRAPLDEIGPRLVRKARRKLTDAAEALASSATPRKAHAVRLRAKRMRYALEFIGPHDTRATRALIAALTRIQDELGNSQDHVVAVANLKKIAEEADDLREPTLRAIAELSEVHVRRSEALRRELVPLMKKLRGKRWKRWKRAAAQPQPISTAARE